MRERRNRWRKVCKCPNIVLNPDVTGNRCITCGNTIITLERRKEVSIPKVTHLRITDRPPNLELLLGKSRNKRKLYETMEAIAILDSSKVIRTTVEEMGYKDFGGVYRAVMSQAKKRDLYVGVVEDGREVIIFNRRKD